MLIQLIAQPFTDQSNLVVFLQKIADDPSVERLDIVVAWAKRSGFDQVRNALNRFVARGGHLCMIVGIGEGGATKQGLELTLALATEAYVFHNPYGRTFHPKLYVATGHDVAHILVGSQNLTRGGTVENYELGVQVEAYPAESESDDTFVHSVVSFVRRLIDDRELCIGLTERVLEAIVHDPRYRVGDEDDPHRKSTRDGTEVDDAGTGLAQDEDARAEALFGRSSFQLRTAKRIAARSGDAGVPGQGQGDLSDQPHRKAALIEPAGSPSPRRRWYKELRGSDAQRPSSGHPSGHLTLTQGVHRIDTYRYFREDFFSSADWITVNPLGREQAIVRFQVQARGQDLGIYDLIVDHNPAFESGQGNRTITLRWGSELGAYLRESVDHVGDIVTLEALDDGTYRLMIDTTNNGPFL
jgi:hypothetical protein